MSPTPRALIETLVTSVSLMILLTACSSGVFSADEPGDAMGLLADASSPVDPAAPAAPDPLPVATAEVQPGGGIAWNQAVDHAGTTQRVCGPLAGGGNSDDDVFLNLGRDYPDPERFQIVVWDVGSLESIDGGVTLCTSGPITLYEGVAQIELTDPTLIEVYN